VSVGSLPEVAEELKLTQEQTRDLLGGSSTESVLSAEQQKTWKEMKGEPFKGTLTPGGVAGFARGATRAPVLPARFRYLQEKVLQTELKLSDAQVSELADLPAQWTQAMQDHQTWTAEERPGKIEKAIESLEAIVKKTLSAAQRKRFEQVLLQQVRITPGSGRIGIAAALAAPSEAWRGGESGLPAVLLYPPAVSRLGLTEKQGQQVVQIVSNAERTAGLIRSELARIPGGPSDLVRSTVVALYDQADQKLREVLTEKQRAAVKEMLGEPFRGLFTPWGRPAR
jgi:hypothetical protein